MSRNRKALTTDGSLFWAAGGCVQSTLCMRRGLAQAGWLLGFCFTSFAILLLFLCFRSECRASWVLSKYIATIQGLAKLHRLALNFQSCLHYSAGLFFLK